MSGLFKYADDSNISPVWKDEDNSEEMVQQFLEWSRRNSMKSNPAKCKELSFWKKCCIETFPLVFGIPQQSSIVILGVTFQEDSRFTIHCSLRKEGHRQEEIDHLFITSVMNVLPNITYALSIYGASKPELTKIQCFLERCYKRRYISKEISVHELLENQDQKLFSQVEKTQDHPLKSILPKKKINRYDLRNKCSNFPKINTERFKNCYINRLIFKYTLAL